MSGACPKIFGVSAYRMRRVRNQANQQDGQDDTGRLEDLLHDIGPGIVRRIYLWGDADQSGACTANHHREGARK